jgi:hypothetical protein
MYLTRNLGLNRHLNPGFSRPEKIIKIQSKNGKKIVHMGGKITPKNTLFYKVLKAV